MPQQKRAQATRAAIIRGAAVVFDEHGYSDASLDLVAETAKVTKGALYFHFRSKADLANAVIAEQHALSRAYADQVSETAGSGAEALMLSCASLATQLTTEVLVTAGIRLTTQSPSRDLRVEHPYLDWQAQISGLVERAVADGDFRDDTDVESVARFVVGSYAGVHIVSQALTGRSDLFDRLRDMWAFVLPTVVAPGHEGLTSSLPPLIRPSDVPPSPDVSSVHPG
ncbi:ScbR family autoregulator-binding transcription factor [Frigoribacterium sp. MCBA15_019]|uniref:ScbR family autoregulator-binding transcription factor n=1 Tax=unclassified Frigoribacterium TaxID=2627005 RepID=UPI0008DD2BE4|nr:ScbR family autoregulator-binding transcription factor [Frigoribacterium sp. MCBA15_019]OII24979.1 hypothetical protein BIV04_15840 [Frigoribacterium sp. MCBA15_019]